MVRGTLCSRVDNPADNLSLRECLAVIAPNSFVRDDLRGLFGWMASVGGAAIQKTAIGMDPYAVLANGDPSRLSTSSKRQLLSRLREVAETDPYFRGTDFGRTFGTAGFFTEEVIKIVRPILADQKASSHFRDLLLEMIRSSGAVPQLTPEIQVLMLDSAHDGDTRVLAYECLAAAEGHDHVSDLAKLVEENSCVALEISSYIYRDLGVNKLGIDRLLNLLRANVRLHETPAQKNFEYFRQRAAVHDLINGLEVHHVVRLLDHLTDGLACTCGAENLFDCHCRDAISKIIGRLLDRYFSIATGPFDPEKIWRWVRNLQFHDSINLRDSASVQALQNDNHLRRSIHRDVLSNVTDRDQIFELRHYSFERYSHAGLSFRADDDRAIVDHAFKRDNPNLWISFFPAHTSYRKTHDPLRAHMRCQANLKPAFMRKWAKWNRASMRNLRRLHGETKKWNRRWKREEADAEQERAESLRYLDENRLRIETGRDLVWLKHVSWLYLNDREELANHVDDPELPERALCNCIPFLQIDLPSLGKVAELHCRGSRTVMPWETILSAACLAVFRRLGSLDSFDRDTLAVLKTDFDVAYHQRLEEEFRERFKAELNRCLFRNVGDLRLFARQYLEPQLGLPHCEHSRVNWLRYKPEFAELRYTFPLEWLRQFLDAPINALHTLFGLASKYCNRIELEELVSFRCSEIDTPAINQLANEDFRKRKDFWRLREFFYLDNVSVEVEQWLTSDPNVIFALHDCIGRLHRSDNEEWPDLSVGKVFLVLDAFVDAWPIVHLPPGYGTDSPKPETAYRFLREIIWMIEKDLPANRIPVLESIIADGRFRDFHAAARNMLVTANRDRALMDFRPPLPAEIVRLLHEDQPVTVEGLRAVLIGEIEKLQEHIRGSEFDPIEKFYSGGKRVDEPTASKRIAEHLELSLAPKNLGVTIEHQFNPCLTCAVERRVTLVGANPTQQLSLRLVAARAVHGGNEMN